MKNAKHGIKRTKQGFIGENIPNKVVNQLLVDYADQGFWLWDYDVLVSLAKDLYQSTPDKEALYLQLCNQLNLEIKTVVISTSDATDIDDLAKEGFEIAGRDENESALLEIEAEIEERNAFAAREAEQLLIDHSSGEEKAKLSLGNEHFLFSSEYILAARLQQQCVLREAERSALLKTETTSIENKSNANSDSQHTACFFTPEAKSEKSKARRRLAFGLEELEQDKGTTDEVFGQCMLK